MAKSKSTKQPDQVDVSSCRLTDKFSELPEEIILKMILPKIGEDTKTLVRCSLVSKRLSAIISKIDTVSLIILITSKEEDHLPCTQSHNYHIPQAAIPAFMKVFKNVKSLKVKLCSYSSSAPSPWQRYSHLLMLKALIDGSGTDIQIQRYFAARIGWLYRNISCEYHRLPLESFPVFDHSHLCLKKILQHRPESLSNVVIYYAHLVEEKRCLARKQLLMPDEQLANFGTFRASVRWSDQVDNPKNFVFCLNNPKLNCLEDSFGLWRLCLWESSHSEDEMREISSLDDPVLTEKNVKELWSVLDNDGENMPST